MKYYIIDTEHSFNSDAMNKMKRLYDSSASFEMHLRRAIKRARYCANDVNVYNERGELVATVFTMGYDKTPKLKMVNAIC